MSFTYRTCIHRECSCLHSDSEKEGGNNRWKKKGQPKQEHHVFIVVLSLDTVLDVWREEAFTKCPTCDEHEAIWADEPLISCRLMSASYKSFISPGGALTQWGIGARGQMPCCPGLSNVSMLSDSGCIYIHITTGTLQGGRWHSTLWACRDWQDRRGRRGNGRWWWGIYTHITKQHAGTKHNTDTDTEL